jgi:hypothetical protein
MKIKNRKTLMEIKKLDNEFLKKRDKQQKLFLKKRKNLIKNIK